MMIPNWLVQRRSISPDRLAVVASGERLTYRDLSQRVDNLARRLAATGIDSGDRVALLMRNSLSFVLLTHAVSRIGAVLVPLNIRLTPSELIWQLLDVDAKCLIYDEANAETATAIQSELPQLKAFTHAELPSEGNVLLQGMIDLDAVHSIIYTSGTTGKPKGAMLTYGNHWWSATGSSLNLGLLVDDVWLAVLPLFHVGGLAILLRGVIYGNLVIVHDSFDPAVVNRAIDEERVTIMSVVSAMLQRLLDQRGDVPYPSSLRCMLLGGGPAPRPLLEACAAQHIPVVQTYGMTETSSQFVTLAPEDALSKLGSAGKPLLPNLLRIEQAGSILSADEVGEIVVNGPTVTAGYINRPNATATAIRDGWLRTGDLGYLDQDGYLYVVSRRDDLIISGGENIYPAEIEAVLLAHPAVEEAAVFGIADEKWGQVPVAAVKLRDSSVIEMESLRTFCSQRLARYKIPAHFWQVSALPRNAAGKLLRRVLVERHSAAQNNQGEITSP